MSSGLNVVFSPRPVEADDYRLIIDTFKRSMIMANRVRRNRRAFLGYHRGWFDQVLEHPDTTVTVLCLASDPAHIAGWMAYTKLPKNTVLHYAHVKHGYRPLRLFDDLLRAAEIRGRHVAYTFQSPVAEAICKRLVKDGWIRSYTYLAAEQFLASLGDNDESETRSHNPIHARSTRQGVIGGGAL